MKKIISQSLNNIDLLILNTLIDNSRLSIRSISKKLGLAPLTVMKHLKKLESLGIIKKYTVLLDYDALGFEFTAVIDLKIAKGKLFEVEKKVAKHYNVQMLFDVTGQTDAVVIARFRNRKALDSFIKEIQKYDFIEGTHTRIALNTIKEEPLKV